MAATGPIGGRSYASLLIGVTGKLDLRGADDAVRAALDLTFQRLDARCPTTPKILLSGLARGADTVAADAALARPGWSVIAVLPFSVDLYLQDFDEPAAGKLRLLLADPRVKRLELDALQRTPGGVPTSAADLSRTTAGPHPLRSDHYEQVGLFIGERAAILLAVMDAHEPRGKIGGTARIVHHRLTGVLDEDARRIVNASLVLDEARRMVDRRSGPVWVVDLEKLVGAPAPPASALLVRTSASTESPLGDNRVTNLSLRLADGLEGVNARIARIAQGDWDKLASHAGPDVGDASSHLRRLRAAIGLVQAQASSRVRGSIWQMAALSCAAILAFEVYVAWPRQDWTRLGIVLYPLLVGAAVLIYWRTAGPRWQRFAEDYRGAAEALRVQLVWWASGLTQRSDRIERVYLRGARGALGQLRVLISALIDAALLQFDRPALDLAAAERWVKDQIRFFESRIASRQREIAVVESASWFLFVASLSVAVCLAISQPWRLWRPLLHLGGTGPSDPLRSVCRWCSSDGLPTFFAAVAIFLGLFLFAVRPRRRDDGDHAPRLVAKSNLQVGIAAAVAGLALWFSLVDLAMFVPIAGADVDTRAAWARELSAIAVILPLTVAGAIRYVSEKSSWSAELSGYEHACEHFRRGQSDMSAAADTADPGGLARREIVRWLGEEALNENANWLRSHRERPIEPIVGG